MSATADDRVNAAIAEYLDACDAGNPPDRAAFLAKHPDLAGSLAAFLDDHARMKRAAPPAGNTLTVPPDAGNAETMAPAPTYRTDPLGSVRYVGDYELLSEIARGGMGVVFKARQVSLNRVVAVK